MRWAGIPAVSPGTLLAFAAGMLTHRGLRLFALALYPYNLDQGGPFPAGEALPYLAIRREHWYAIDIQVKQNSLSGASDADGNRTAMADGEYRIWINGYPAYEKTKFRWRRDDRKGQWFHTRREAWIAANREMLKFAVEKSANPESSP